ncbi:MAG TPA: metallopeptidase family protein [Candidatus Saccharimonadales bacterium]|nr:metallopeptidase family protein [Candidatus Saccharimonadales bacterium]
MSDEQRARDEMLREAWRRLDEGDAEGALIEARSLIGGDDALADAHYLAGSALMEMDRLGEAEPYLRRVLDLSDGHAGAREALAQLLYETCRFRETRSELELLLEAEPDNPQAHHLASLLAERRGEYALAEEEERMAHRFAPELYPLPPRFTREEFEHYVEEAIESLPGEFRDPMGNLAVVVEDVPSTALLRTLEDPSPGLLGLFVGTALPEKSLGDVPQAPDAVYLFKRNLERICEDHAELVEEIRITLLHEVGHFLGLDEQQLSDRGYE